MQIYVGKKGAITSSSLFDREDLSQTLADGSFAASDLAWYEGTAAWAPLSQVAGVVIPWRRPPVTPVPSTCAEPGARAPIAASCLANSARNALPLF